MLIVNEPSWGSIEILSGYASNWCRDDKTCNFSTTVEAFASSGYHFTRWILDGTTYYENPITVNTTVSGTAITKNLKAYFEPD